MVMDTILLLKLGGIVWVARFKSKLKEKISFELVAMKRGLLADENKFKYMHVEAD